MSATETFPVAHKTTQRLNPNGCHKSRSYEKSLHPNYSIHPREHNEVVKTRGLAPHSPDIRLCDKVFREDGTLLN